MQGEVEGEMTKDEYWQAHVKKNPKLADEDGSVQVKVSTLHALLNEAFDKGWEHHKKITDQMRDMLKGTGLGNIF